MGKVFTTRMKELRAKKGISQQELADLVGVRRETIVRLEKGNYNPTLSLAVDIANIFEESIESVFIFKDT